MVDGYQPEARVLEVNHPGQRVVIELISYAWGRRDVTAGIDGDRHTVPPSHQPACFFGVTRSRVIKDRRWDLGGENQGCFAGYLPQ